MEGTPFSEAAETISQATALIITAGAGMGVDSGLPDFRGNQGFWNAYPMYAKLGLTFIQAANPDHFEDDPNFGWGFYGHRTNLYRRTEPHAGFKLLQDWIARFKLDYFIATSNVDGQFQKAGFSDANILEVHGSIHHLQCTLPCNHSIWANQAEYIIDEQTMRAGQIPSCISCQQVARPNILMFGDSTWLPHRTAAQEANFKNFLARNSNSRIVVIEIGAGTAIPTIRNLSENLGSKTNTRVIRINPREPQISSPHLSFSESAVTTLTQIDSLIAFDKKCR